MIRKLSLLIILPYFFLCCSKDINDTEAICTSDCTTITGSIKRADNLPVAHVKVTLAFYRSGINHFWRYIDITTTDANGNFVMEANIRDSELDGTPFYLFIDPVQLENALPSEFLKPSAFSTENREDALTLFAPGISDRNQPIVFEPFIIPFKTTMTINLNEFTPIEPFYSFYAGTSIRYGNQERTSSVSSVHTNGPAESTTFQTAIGPNFIRINRFNGLEDNSYDTIVTSPEPTILDYDFN